MNLSWQMNLALCFMAGLGVIAPIDACKCSKDQPIPTPSASVVAFATSSASAESQHADAPKVAATEVVAVLPSILGCYEQKLGDEERMMFIDVRGESNEGEWNIPYPYQFAADAGAYDCGFFPKIHGDGWRTAYCVDGADRVAKRLYLFRAVDGRMGYKLDDFTDFGYVEVPCG